jgi:hypothetical protein
MGEVMKFAGMRAESQTEIRSERAFLARFGVSSELPQPVRVIFNKMLICSARPYEEEDSVCRRILGSRRLIPLANFRNHKDGLVITNLHLSR